MNTCESYQVTKTLKTLTKTMLLTLMSDQDKNFPYNIKQISDEDDDKGIVIDAIPNSPN